MTREGWKQSIAQAVNDALNGDASLVDLLASLLEEQDNAKASLQNKGYGCCGIPWVDLVEEIPSANEVRA